MLAMKAFSDVPYRSGLDLFSRSICNCARRNLMACWRSLELGMEHGDASTLATGMDGGFLTLKYFCASRKACRPFLLEACCFTR